RSGLPRGTSRTFFRPRGRSYRSQLLFRLTGGIRHATPAPLCSPSKPVRPQVLKEPARSITRGASQAFLAGRRANLAEAIAKSSGDSQEGAPARRARGRAGRAAPPGRGTRPH